MSDSGGGQEGGGQTGTEPPLGSGHEVPAVRQELDDHEAVSVQSGQPRQTVQHQVSLQVFRQPGAGDSDPLVRVRPPSVQHALRSRVTQG